MPLVDDDMLEKLHRAPRQPRRGECRLLGEIRRARRAGAAAIVLDHRPDGESLRPVEGDSSAAAADPDVRRGVGDPVWKDDLLVFGFQEGRRGELSWEIGARGVDGLRPERRGGRGQHVRTGMAEHVGRSVGDVVAGPLDDGPRHLVDALDVDAGFVESAGQGDGLVEATYGGGEIVGEIAGERREEQSGGGIAAGQVTGAMDRDDRLACPGAAGESKGPVAVLVGVRALFGVEEKSPRAEVALLDDAAQLGVVVDEVERCLRGRVHLDGLDDPGVLVGGLHDWGVVEAEHCSHVGEGAPGGELQQGVGLPSHARHADDVVDQGVLGRGG